MWRRENNWLSQFVMHPASRNYGLNKAEQIDSGKIMGDERLIMSRKRLLALFLRGLLKSLSPTIKEKRVDLALAVFGLIFLYEEGYLSTEAFHRSFWELAMPWILLFCALLGWNILKTAHLLDRQLTPQPRSGAASTHPRLRLYMIAGGFLAFPALFSYLAWHGATVPDVSARFHSTNSSQYSFQTFDYPGAMGTEALGANDSEMIVGQYTLPGSPGHANGYLLSKGVFAKVDFPGALGTSVDGINNRAEAVGAYATESNQGHGFLRQDHEFRAVDFPDGNGTVAVGINNSGHIVGLYQDSTGKTHGFLDRAGTFMTIDVPGATLTAALGINSSDDIVGWYMDTSRATHGFLRSKATFQTLDVPGASSTWAYAVNTSGEIVGYYTDSTGSSHGYVLHKDGLLRLDVPGASNTRCFGINTKGHVVGTAYDSAGEHGFLALPK